VTLVEVANKQRSPKSNGRIYKGVQTTNLSFFHTTMSTQETQAMDVLDDVLNDLRAHLDDAPNDEASDGEWEQWGKKYMDIMVSKTF
jgi:hypothetical protein